MGEERCRQRSGEVNAKGVKAPWSSIKMLIQKAVDQIRERVVGVSDIYHRLLLVVGPAGSGKTASLREFANQGKHPMVNIGLELARRLLDLTERQRILQVPKLVDDIVSETGADMVILDNTEILFNPALGQDPLRLLLGLSRNRTIVASWLGASDGPHLTYARPDHPEYRKYQSDDLLVISLSDHAGEPVNC
jgi:hypothetical protein